MLVALILSREIPPETFQIKMRSANNMHHNPVNYDQSKKTWSTSLGINHKDQPVSE